PTELALQLAEVGNVTVVGYLRGSRMTVYTHSERIRFA
ncbi:MAG: formate dehydrogenase accessory sulfurtransferase FdhD, partial [Anaerolineae bacterium]